MMTETQGDWVGCAIVMIGLVTLILGVAQIEYYQTNRSRRFFWLTVILMISGVAVVVFT